MSGPPPAPLNLDWRGFLRNQELNAVVLGSEFGAQLCTMFEQDPADSDAITLAQWERMLLNPPALRVLAVNSLPVGARLRVKVLSADSQVGSFPMAESPAGHHSAAIVLESFHEFPSL